MRPFDRAWFVVIAVAWLGVGWKGNAPVLEPETWMAACAVPAGSAFAVTRHLSMFSLRSFLATTWIVALMRSAAYASDDAWGPLYVWVIVVGLAVLVQDRLRREI